MERAASEVRRIITLASGRSRGSNLLAIHSYLSRFAPDISIHTAVFTDAKSEGVARANARGIPAKIIPARDLKAFELKLLRLVRDENIELIALCGFMKLLSRDFIERAGVPILNIHPALLPKYGGKGMYGMRVHEAVLAAGEKRSGATIHYVNPVYDAGQIIVQKSIDISGFNTAEEIAQAVLAVEHGLYPRAIERVLKPRVLKVAINTLGCKTNFFESAVITGAFEDAEIVEFKSDADIYIINSCSVTNRADYKSRNQIRKALAKKELDPFVKVVVTGCFAQREKESIQALGEIDLIVDNQSKLNIADILSGQTYEWQEISAAEEFAFRPVKNMLDHTRAFQKVQDGCDFHCAYCAVPSGRGKSRSARFEDALSQARLFVEQGFKEIVLGGVNLGLYHDKGRDLADLVEAMALLEGLKLIRISSIEPQLLSSEMLKRLSKVEKLCPHFHIPLQSASDTVLQMMKRRYSFSLVRDLVAEIYRLFPHAAIGFDVITGFPGESEALFEEGFAALKALPFSYLHVFSYSKRRGTVADRLPAQISNKEKTRRAGLLVALSDQKKRDYAALLQERNVLLRGVAETGHECLSDRYLRMRLPEAVQIGDYVERLVADVEFLDLPPRR